MSSAEYFYTTQTEFKFTNCKAEGALGPTYQACIDEYLKDDNHWIQNKSFFDVIDGVQIWSPPYTSIYKIEVVGASGGDNLLSEGGYGAKLVSYEYLSRHNKLYIVVGQKGGDVDSKLDYKCGTGGGGGTFMYTESNMNVRTFIAVAGGGGGALSTYKNLKSSQVDAHGKANTSVGTSIKTPSTTIWHGGKFGLCGRQSHRNILCGAHGKGIFVEQYHVGLKTIKNYRTTYSKFKGHYDAVSSGGFGGGGSARGEIIFTKYLWAGGGGGYSGGAAGGNSGYSDGQYGGGGGSYHSGQTIEKQSGYNKGHGYVIITKVDKI
jgi:hypothetical protein